MAGSMTDHLEKRVLDLIFRNDNASATVPFGLDATNLWVGLFTATPSETGAGTEVAGNNYARVAVARSGTPAWTAATGTLGTTNNAATITFPAASGPWGTVTQFGIFDAPTGGNLLYWGDLPEPKTIDLGGDIPSFAAGAIAVTQA